MTDRYSGFIVTLKSDMRKDDAEDTIKALSMVKGVLSVQPDIGGGHLVMAEDRVKHRYYMAMHDAVRNVFESTPERKHEEVIRSMFGSTYKSFALPPPPQKKRFMEPWQWSDIFFISLAAALAIIIVGVRMKDARVEALQKMEKACAGH